MATRLPPAESQDGVHRSACVQATATAGGHEGGGVGPGRGRGVA